MENCKATPAFVLDRRLSHHNAPPSAGTPVRCSGCEAALSFVLKLCEDDFLVESEWVMRIVNGIALAIWDLEQHLGAVSVGVV
jgi:hypothetical protein